MPRSELYKALREPQGTLRDQPSWRQQEAHKRLLQQVAQAVQDYPILPTSDTNPTPGLSEEADDNLSPPQRLAVAAIVRGATFCAAAREAGITRRTLFAWRQQPAFQRAVEQLSREAMSAAVVRVRNLMLRATRVLSEAMLDERKGATAAFRVLNSRHLWMTATAPADPEEEQEPAIDGSDPLDPAPPHAAGDHPAAQPEPADEDAGVAREVGPEVREEGDVPSEIGKVGSPQSTVRDMQASRTRVRPSVDHRLLTVDSPP